MYLKTVILDLEYGHFALLKWHMLAIVQSKWLQPKSIEISLIPTNIIIIIQRYLFEN